MVKKLSFFQVFIIFFISNFVSAQTLKCRTTADEFQYMSWAINSEDITLQTRFVKGSTITNNLHNIYFFSYTPVYRREEKCLVGYNVILSNKKNNTSRMIAIPYENPTEFENLFNEIMGWPLDERNAFLKSYIIFQNTNEGYL